MFKTIEDDIVHINTNVPFLWWRGGVQGSHRVLYFTGNFSVQFALHSGFIKCYRQLSAIPVKRKKKKNMSLALHEMACFYSNDTKACYYSVCRRSLCDRGT